MVGWLGSTLVHGDVLAAGAFGLMVAWIVVVAVRDAAVEVAGNMAVDEEPAVERAGGLPICGVLAIHLITRVLTRLTN